MTTEITTQSNTMIDIIAKAASDPNVDVAKLEKLLDMQERIMVKQAELDYNAAMSDMQPLLPQIPKTKKAHNSLYAPYEEVDKIIKPIYTKFGFSLSFDSKEQDGKVTYFGKCAHKNGFSETKQITLPADNSGSKNPIQAVASTISYAKRYLVGMLLNIVTMDEDTDGLRGSDILPDAMLSEIKKLVEETKTNLPAFLKYMKVDSFDKILNKDYVKAKTMLTQKKQKAVA